VLFDGDAGEFHSSMPGERDPELQGGLRAFGSVVRHEDVLEHRCHSLLAPVGTTVPHMVFVWGYLTDGESAYR
jgi:hypothetical protein